jgi:hypothetical protein
VRTQVPEDLTQIAIDPLCNLQAAHVCFQLRTFVVCQFEALALSLGECVSLD